MKIPLQLLTPHGCVISSGVNANCLLICCASKFLALASQRISSSSVSEGMHLIKASWLSQTELMWWSILDGRMAGPRQRDHLRMYEISANRTTRPLVAIRQIPPRKAECPRLSLNYRHRSGVCVIAELPRLHTRIKFNCHRGPKTFNFAGRKFSIFISHLLDGGKEVAHAARLICLHKSCSNASHLRRRIPIGE